MVAGVTDKPLGVVVVLPEAEGNDALDKRLSTLKGGKYAPEYLVDTVNGKPPNLTAPDKVTNRQQRIDFIQAFGSVEAQRSLQAILDSDLSKEDKNIAIRALVNDIRAGAALLKAENGEKLTDFEKNAYTNAVLTRIPGDTAALEKAMADHPEGGKPAVMAYLQNLTDQGAISESKRDKLIAMYDKAVELNDGNETGVANRMLDILTWDLIPDTPATMKPVVDAENKTATSRFGNYSVTMATDPETGKRLAVITNVVSGEETVVDPELLKDGTFELEDPAGYVRFDLQGDGKTVVVSIKPYEDTPDSEISMLKWKANGDFAEVTNTELRENLVENWSPAIQTLYEISGKQYSGAHFTTKKPAAPAP
jgi:hypothetical protein